MIGTLTSDIAEVILYLVACTGRTRTLKDRSEKQTERMKGVVTRARILGAARMLAMRTELAMRPSKAKMTAQRPIAVVLSKMMVWLSGRSILQAQAPDSFLQEAPSCQQGGRLVFMAELLAD